ncbi:MAG: hypothetical protein KDA28_00225, partial [Phycisphaerales bacterium]|nr:hypothetical protein [Phycisphaerales bacterium]
MTPARAVVMGLGRFGGGVGVTRWLASRGAHILVSDRDDAETLAPSIGAIADLVEQGVVTVHTGAHDPADLDGAD